MRIISFARNAALLIAATTIPLWDSRTQAI